MSKRVRYTVKDVSNNRFYQMPKFLFEGEFKSLSNNARVLYSLLRDRHDLSLENEWVNENNEVYLIYTRKKLGEMLGLTDKTIKTAIEKLKELGLMEEEQLGLNRANRIYLTSVNIETTGGGKIPSQNRKNSDSRKGKTPSQEPENFPSNDTDSIDTDSIDTDINQSINKEQKSDGSIDINIDDINNSSEETKMLALKPELIYREIKTNKGIPYKYKVNEEQMKVAIHVLTDYKHYCNAYDDDIKQSAFNLAVECLITMATSDDLMTIKGSKISYKKVIDKINDSIDFSEKTININVFIDEAVNDYVEAAKTRNIKNHIAYIKSCIWNSLLNHKVKFNANLHKIING